jgi:ribose transport system ATP-binding protein
MIFQEMSLIPTLSVAQNVFLAREHKDSLGLINDRSAERETQRLFELLDVEVDPSAIVSDLGAGQRQLTEIVKALAKDPSVLILDEPSSALSTADVERLFAVLRKLKSEARAIVYVSHRMDEIARIADRATILRDGRNVITADLADLPIESMIEHIVGKRSRGLSDVVRDERALGDALLEIKHVSGLHKPRDVTFTVHRGEVVGLAGLLGSGRSSLARVLAGIDPMAAGEIRISGKRVDIRRPADAIKRGIVLVPEDRLREGVIAEHSVSDNLSLAGLDRVSKRNLVSARETRVLAERQITDLKIKTASRDHAVRTLSGGNQQKVVIGKWLGLDPDILILDEPTAGIDIGSKSEIILLVRKLAATGKAILMISSELSELLSACDRIIVMANGRQYEDLRRSDLDDPALDPLATDADPLAQMQAAEQRLQRHIQTVNTVEAEYRHVNQSLA